MGMGFSSKLATRALRFCNSDVGQAADWCVQQRAARVARRDRDAASAAKRRLQLKLGRTLEGKWLDMEALGQLEQLGFEQPLACEALKCVLSALLTRVTSGTGF